MDSSSSPASAAATGSAAGAAAGKKKKNKKWGEDVVRSADLQHPLIRNPYDFRRHHFVDERILRVILGYDPSLGIPRSILDRPTFRTARSMWMHAGENSNAKAAGIPKGGALAKESDVCYLHDQDRSLFLDDGMENATIADFRRQRYVRRKVRYQL
jgi:hypothetical protein